VRTPEAVLNVPPPCALFVAVAVFCATNVPVINREPSLYAPPPCALFVALTTLPAIVPRRISAAPKNQLYTPPPSADPPLAVLSLTCESSMMSVPPLFNTPPPSASAKPETLVAAAVLLLTDELVM